MERAFFWMDDMGFEISGTAGTANLAAGLDQSTRCIATSIATPTV